MQERIYTDDWPGWLANVIRELTTGLDLNSIVRRALALAVQSVGADLGSLILVDERGHALSVVLFFEGKFHRGSLELANRVLQEGLGGWVLRHREAVQIADVEEDTRWLKEPEPGLTAFARSVLCAPMVSPRRPIGVLTCIHSQPGFWGKTDLQALRFIADQAAIALENAWLFSLEEQRRHLADTLREIARTLTSTLELDEVLRLILEHLSRVVPHDSASIFLLEGNRLVIRAWRGFGNVEGIRDLSFPVKGDHIMSRVLACREPLVCADVQQEKGWLNVPGVHLIHGWIGAPLVARGQPVGVLTVDSTRSHAYTSEDARVVAAFADHAAVAIANAQLLRQLQRRLSELSFLYQTGQDLTASLELDDVLRSLLKTVQSHFHVDAVSVALVDEETRDLVFRFATGAAANEIIGVRLKPGQGIAGWVAQTGVPLMVPVVQQDARWYPGVDEQTGFHTRSVVAVPIRIGTEILGVLEMINPPNGELGEEDLKLLMSVAALAASAIQNARHFRRAREAEERYTRLFENSADPILITTLEGSITEANQTFLRTMGYSREDVIGQSLSALTPQTDRVATWLQQIAQEGRSGGNLEIVSSSGTAVPFEVRATCIQVGAASYIQWVLHDLSERIRLERAREDLVHMIIHDLRNPLSSIMSSLDLIRATVTDPSLNLPLDQLFDVARRSGERLFLLIDSILDLARLEAGETELRWELISVAELVRETTNQVRPLALGREILLETHLAPDLPPVLGDRELLQRVLVNLLDNALKYTPPGGKVTVTAEWLPSETLLFAVSDTGPGIPPEHQARIFDRFVRVPGQRTGGTGIGLAFCKLAVEAHGGKIWVESKMGEGATFKFTLPATLSRRDM
ncbi:MAG: GAF domain-containing protein [Anaerolineae bacterium]|nr:GAF domain-containing protein [Anaerolineae bacterium]MCX8068795.1 GAF domain-containing protein [Anaerolineae bacterium]MDW7990737.1 GAF domain-containing protein [Anaerolineae bacterium]